MAIGIETGAEWHLASVTGGDLNVAHRHRRRSHVIADRAMSRARPGKGNRIGAKQLCRGSDRRHHWHVGGAGNANQPTISQIFGLWPEGGKMMDAGQRQGRDADLLRRLGQHRQGRGLCQRGETSMSLAGDHRRGLFRHRRAGGSVDLAALQRLHIPRNAKQPVRM